MTKVAHVNVRYNDGGAARVMHALASAQQRAGDSVRILYGYGAHGRQDVRANSDSRAAQLCRTSQVAVNFAGARAGVPLPWAGYNRELLTTEARRADIVHLHAIHSYMGNPLTIFEDVLRDSKKVVMTVHDSWILTGRCAVPGECLGYLRGCAPCRNMAAYPPAFIDNSATEWRKKRDLVTYAGHKLTLVALTATMAEKLREAYPMTRLEVIANGTWEPSDLPFSERPCSRKPTLAVVAADLSDRSKIDWDQLRRIVEKTEWKITTIGAKPQLVHPKIRNLGVIMDRAVLLRVVGECDALLFQSRVDSFGLVVAESLCMGTPAIVFEKTEAAKIVAQFGLSAPAAEDELLESLSGQYWLRWQDSHRRRELAEKARAMFAVSKMAQEYKELYESTA